MRLGMLNCCQWRRLVLAAVCLMATLAADVSAEGRRTVVEFFYDGACPECVDLRVKLQTEVIPLFPEVDFHEYDVRDERNLARRLALQEKLGITAMHASAAILDEQVYLGGNAAIEQRLVPLLNELVQMDKTAPLFKGAPRPEKSTPLLFAARLRPLTILGAGLVDGLNPCAFSAILFLASLLLLRRRALGGWRLFGIMFCGGAFLAYLALGAGILRGLIGLAGWHWARFALHWGMIVLLLIVSVGSLYDAWIFYHTSRAERLLLRLPAFLQDWVHRSARDSVPTEVSRRLRLALSAFGLGAVIAVLEAPCTGQIYLPVLFYLSRQSEWGRLWWWLLAYNFMFILPQALVFVLAAVCGDSGVRLAEWGRRNVIGAKILAAAAALILAGLLAVF